MSGVLIDTKVISELRKGTRANRHVLAWFATVPASEIHLSVLVVGELRKGIEKIRRNDARSALALDAWLATLTSRYADRILPIDPSVAEAWGRIEAIGPFPVIDALLAATAIVHDLVLVTRNVRDVARTGARILDPFHPPRPDG